jgi:hypothetical protein
MSQGPAISQRGVEAENKIESQHHVNVKDWIADTLSSWPFLKMLLIIWSIPQLMSCASCIPLNLSVSRFLCEPIFLPAFPPDLNLTFLHVAPIQCVAPPIDH